MFLSYWPPKLEKFLKLIIFEVKKITVNVNYRENSENLDEEIPEIKPENSQIIDCDNFARIFFRICDITYRYKTNFDKKICCQVWVTCK